MDLRDLRKRNSDMTKDRRVTSREWSSGHATADTARVSIRTTHFPKSFLQYTTLQQR